MERDEGRKMEGRGILGRCMREGGKGRERVQGMRVKRDER
jgi:hypothetical protein